MVAEGNRDEVNDESIEDGLSALKRLAALDTAETGASASDIPAQAIDVVESVPDWLELLLAKYGEQASELVGVRRGLPELVIPSPESVDESDVVSPLEHVATDAESEALADRLATALDWGDLSSGEDKGAEDQTPPPSAARLPEGEVPDWLEDLAGTGLDAEGQPAGLERPEPEADAPDWIRQLGVTAAAEEALTAGQETEAPSEVPGPRDEAEVADWLAQLADTSPTQVEEAAAVQPPSEMPAVSPPEAGAPAPAQPPGPEIPEWLRELETAETVPAEPPEPEIPDWLRELEAVEETPTIEPPSPDIAGALPVESDADIPDWLSSLREETPFPLDMMAEEETAPPDYPPGEPAEEPEWLAALRTTVKPEMLELDAEVFEAQEEDLPDWLAELRTSPTGPEMPPQLEEQKEEGLPEAYQPPSEIEAAPEAEEEVDTLAWLADIQAAAAISERAEGEVTPAEAEAPSAPEEVPDWLRQMPPADLTFEAEAPEGERETAETRRLPEWLVAETTPGSGEEVGEVAPPAEEVPEVAEEVAPAVIPEWLMDLKPEAVGPTELREEEVIEPRDVLADIPGLLPIAEEESEVLEEPVAALRARAGVPEIPDVEGAKLFKEVVAEHPEAGREEGIEVVAAPDAKRKRIVSTLLWALIFIILIAGIALALVAVVSRVGDLLGGPAFREFFGSPLVIDPAPINTFRAQVTRLPPDSVVVVSFDYSPATEAEMEPLAQIILRDLLENEARVIGVSLRPEGPLMAQRLFDRFGNEYPYTERTLNLGYLSGQTAGVRSLAFLSSIPPFQDWGQTLDDYPAWQDVDNLDDVALIVTVADSPLAVRWWVEQMGPGTQGDRPMLAAVSAAADPSVRPYYNHLDPPSGQLLGLVSGIAHAAAYENRLGQSGRAVNSLAAQSVAHLGLVVISLAGTVVGFRMHATRE